MTHWKPFAIACALFTHVVIAAPPVIFVQPVSQTAVAEDVIFFEVYTDDDGSYTYQWRKNGNNISETARITGTKESFLIIDEAVPGDSGTYSVVVKGGGTSVASADATLLVIGPPRITQEPPEEVIVNERSTVTISVKAAGTAPLNYQWYFNGEPLQNGGRISGAKSASLKITNVQPDDEGDYFVTVNNTAGEAYEAWSETTFLIVNVLAVIYTQPQSETVVLGDSVFFEVEADGTDPLTFQWQRNGKSIPDATDEFLILDEVTASDAGTYTVVISNPAGKVTSSNAVLTVLVPPTITSQPQGKMVKTNSIVTLTSRATGTPPLSFQWYYQGVAIPDATSSNYTFTAIDSGQSGAYYVTVSNIVAAVTGLDDYIEESDDAFITVVAETIKPTVAITSPANGARFFDPVITVSGKASDNVTVHEVQFRINNAPFQIADETTSWSATVSMIPGTNVFRVLSVDTSGNKSATLIRRFVYVVMSPFTGTIDGSGNVIPNLDGRALEIGKAYSVKAVPAPGHVFAGWSGGITSTNPVLKFTMQSNLVLRAKFVPNPFPAVKGTYNGLFQNVTGVAHDNSGFVTFKVTDRGALSGKMMIGGATLPFTGALWVDGKTRIKIARKGLPTITMDLNVDLTNQSDRATGTVTDNRIWGGLFSADRVVYSALFPTPKRGKYTLALQGEDAPGTPSGFGATAVAVTPPGIIQLRGNLADGTVVAQNIPISKNGQWPLFLNLYGGRGSIIGWVTFTNQANTALTGLLIWTKPTAPAGLYNNGFSTKLTTIGSNYFPPAAGNRILDFSEGEMTFSGGDIIESFSDWVSISPNNVVKPLSGTNFLSLTITSATGLAKGQFLHPDTNRKTPMNLILLPDQNVGVGYFLGTNVGGGVMLQDAQQ